MASMTSTPIRNVEPDSASRDLASLGKEVKIDLPKEFDDEVVEKLA